MMPNNTLQPSSSLVERLAAFFRAHPGEWIDGRTIATIAGSYAWRTRVSDVRRPPFNMSVTNRQRRVTENGKTFTVSEYLYAGEKGFRSEGAANDAGTSSAAV